MDKVTKSVNKVTKIVTSHGKPVFNRQPPEKGGSRKGIPNKVTGEIKAMILEALANAGGVAYLTDRANDPRTAGAFMSLLGKVLPMQIEGAGGGPVQTALRIEYVTPVPLIEDDK